MKRKFAITWMRKQYNARNGVNAFMDLSPNCKPLNQESNQINQNWIQGLDHFYWFQFLFNAKLLTQWLPKIFIKTVPVVQTLTVLSEEEDSQTNISSSANCGTGVEDMPKDTIMSSMDETDSSFGDISQKRKVGRPITSKRTLARYLSLFVILWTDCVTLCYHFSIHIIFVDNHYIWI